jgi:hypothetical protein
MLRPGEIVLPANGLAPGELPLLTPRVPGELLQGAGLVAF